MRAGFVDKFVNKIMRKQTKNSKWPAAINLLGRNNLATSAFAGLA
jgi:hypothetical protein